MSGSSGMNTKPGRVLRQDAEAFEQQDATAKFCGLTWSQWVRMVLASASHVKPRSKRKAGAK